MGFLPEQTRALLASTRREETRKKMDALMRLEERLGALFGKVKR